MADRYVFSDEAGNFDFSHGSGARRSEFDVWAVGPTHYY